MASLVQTLRRLCGAARASTPDMALIVCVFICIDLFSLAVGVDPSSTSPPSDVPILYRLPCGQDFCDGRTQFCNTNMPTYPNCSFCDDLCGPYGSYTECQEKCRVFLLYNHEQEEVSKRQEETRKMFEDTMASANEKTSRQFSEMKAEIESQQNIAISAVALSVIVLMVVASAVAVLVYVVIQIRKMKCPYGPVMQETEHGDKESGFGTSNNTANNTPESLRKMDVQPREVPENLPLSIITSPAQDPHNTRDTPAPQV